MRARGGLVAFGVALVARLLAVAWGHALVPAADGTYYDTLARRISEGKGYTWLWPDGAVTYAAHYPVGYSALVAVAYRIFGESPVVAMLENALVGALVAPATYVLVSAVTNERRALIAAIIVALHPALVPYTVALMSDGTAVALLAVAAALAQLAATAAETAARARRFWIGSAIVLGVAVLVRPQLVLLAPVIGALTLPAFALRARLVRAAAFSIVSLAVVLPWTARNCVRMERCALVSVNGGWNLLIGAQTDNGSYAQLEVPEECKTVWSEAEKDACFEHAAKLAILRDPSAFVAKIPKKLGATFDYFGAAPWYLAVSSAASAPDAPRFGEREKIALGTIETVVSRALLLLACFGWGVAGKPWGLHRIRGVLGMAFAVSRWGWVSYALLAAVLALEGKRLLRVAILPAVALAVVLETALMHAMFFGGGRYGLVTVPFVAALALAGAKTEASVPSKRSPVRPARAAREESPSSAEYDAG